MNKQFRYSSYDGIAHISNERANEDESERSDIALKCFKISFESMRKHLDKRFSGNSIYLYYPTSSNIHYDRIKGIWYCKFAYMYDHDKNDLNNRAFGVVCRCNKYSFVKSEKYSKEIYYGLRVRADLKPNTKQYYYEGVTEMKQRQFSEEEIKRYRNLFKRYLKKNPGLEKFYFNIFNKVKKVSLEELRRLNWGDSEIPKGDYLYDDQCYGYKILDRKGRLSSYAYARPDIGIVSIHIEEGFSKDAYNIFNIFWMIKFGYEYDKKILSIIEEEHYTDRKHPNSKK